MMNRQKIRIVDTTMRDGEQCPGIAMTRDQKLAVAAKLDELGVWQIEAGCPASGKYEIDTISAIMESRKQSRISTWNRLNTLDLKASFACRPDVIHIGVPVSYHLIYSNLNKNKTWILRQVKECVELAMGEGYEVSVGFQDASRADMTFLITLAVTLQKLGVRLIRLADTVGVFTPSRTAEMVKAIKSVSELEIEMHAHNDLGMAVANSLTAAMSGADCIDTTVLGVGERAGNCDFVDFARVADRRFDLGFSLINACSAEKEIAEILGWTKREPPDE